MEDTEFCHEIINAVLAKSLGAIVEDLEPVGVLDEFVSNDVFHPITKSTVRDMREEAKTSDKNRCIQEKISRNPHIYCTFKLALTNTKQDKLIEILENHEKEEHDSRKERCNCSSTANCELLKSFRCQRSLDKTATDSLPQPKVQSEEKSEEDISSLQAALIEHYRDHKLEVTNPVVAQKLRLDEIYVCPEIKVLKETKNPRAGLRNVQNRTTWENKLYTSVCKQIFCTEDYKSKQIYITSDAGMGKTLFCKYLVHLWCDVCSGTPSDSCSDFDFDSNYPERKALTDDDKRIMSNFKLLFYITLRESTNQYNITEMIDSQILKFIDQNEMLKSSKILQNEGCLVIIDGLDEWACPEDADIPHFVKSGIPGRLGLNKNTVYLTTTKPWKFDVLKLDSPEVDKHVELVGLNKTSSKQLCCKLTKLLSDNKLGERTSNKLWAELNEKSLTHLYNVPVILTQLICLWFDGQDMGQSAVYLYSAMLEMLLKRLDKTSPTCTAASKMEPTETLLPDCFSNRPYCQTHQQLLVSLSRLAFDALFDQKRENALVFESSQIEIYNINEEGIDLCLKSGILSQNIVIGKVSKMEKKISFLHKKLQEFLAALFMVNRENAEIVASCVKTFCTSVDTVLEMSQVWMFVSGIRPNMYEQLLTELLTDVVVIDRRLQEERQTLTDPDLQRSIQTCITGCVEEARSNGHHDLRLPLHDFVIKYDTISECLVNLFTSNLESVKSVYINTDDMTGQGLGCVGRIVRQLQNTRLQKLFLNSTWFDISVLKQAKSAFSDLEETVEKTLTASKFHLTCLQLHDISLTGEALAGVCDTVKSLDLYGISLTHARRDQLLLSVSRAVAIQQLRLSGLSCADHDDECRTALDLSGSTLLQTLFLSGMIIDKLPAVASCVKRVSLIQVTIPERQLEQFVRELSSASHQLTVQLMWVTLTENSGSPADLTYLKNMDNVYVANWEYDGGDSIFSIAFKTRQQTTTDTDNKPQTSTQSA